MVHLLVSELRWRKWILSLIPIRDSLTIFLQLNNYIFKYLTPSKQSPFLEANVSSDICEIPHITW